LAEDVLQEVLVVVWQKASSFKGKGPAANWIFGIAHHQAYKMLRRDAGVKFAELEAAYHLSDATVDLEAAMLGRTTHAEVAAALTLLTPEHREVLELTFFQNFGCKEIAEIVGIPTGTVKSRLSYARHALKKALLSNGWEA
jgi:RNA polymerase sigma-70 factor (ECF subfamily)